MWDGEYWYFSEDGDFPDLGTIVSGGVVIIPTPLPVVEASDDEAYSGPAQVSLWPNGKGATYEPAWDGALYADDCIDLPAVGSPVEVDQWIVPGQFGTVKP